MGYGLIIGEGIQYGYACIVVSSFASLPAAAMNGTIAIVSAVQIGIGGVVFTNKTLAGLNQGDVVIRYGKPVLNMFNMVSSGTVDICPVSVYQWQSGVLVQVPAYIRINSKWSLIFGKPLDEGILVSDTFTRSNGAIGTAEVGGAWSATSVSVVSGKAKGTDTTYTNNATIAVSQVDIGAFADFAWYTGENFSLYARADSGMANFMRVRYDGTNIELTRTISSTNTVMASYAFAWVSAEVHRIGLVCSGNTFGVYLDGSMIISITDDNATKTLLRAGFATQKTGGVPSTTVDNVLIVA